MSSWETLSSSCIFPNNSNDLQNKEERV